jgi:segregation and condensation protein A
MDGIAHPDIGRHEEAEASKGPLAKRTRVPAASAVGTSAPEDPVGDRPETGEGGTPHLTLDGFIGPLDHLLTLARAQKVDLSEISLAALVDQLAAALRQAPAATPLGQKGGWVVMAAWLVQLRARLLLPADTPAQQHAAAEADQLRERLVALQEMQALAAWLEQRPQLGRDMFARGQPEVFGVSIETAHAPDVIEFLWASMALFDDTPAPDTATVYRPIHLDLHPVAEARARILRLLNESPEGALLERLLPEPRGMTEPPGITERPALQRRSGWASTLIASLELARQGDVTLAQDGVFTPIHVSWPPPRPHARLDYGSDAMIGFLADHSHGFAASTDSPG